MNYNKSEDVLSSSLLSLQRANNRNMILGRFPISFCTLLTGSPPIIAAYLLKPPLSENSKKEGVSSEQWIYVWWRFHRRRDGQLPPSKYGNQAILRWTLQTKGFPCDTELLPYLLSLWTKLCETVRTLAGDETSLAEPLPERMVWPDVYQEAA